MAEVGIGVRCITPQRPMILAGYASDRVFDEVHDDIYVKCAFFRSGDGACLIITADLLGFGRALVDDVKCFLNEKYGLPAGHVMMTASHTHSAPATMEHASAYWKVEPEYMKWLKRQIIDASEEAISVVKPCELSIGRGRCGAGINRRKYMNGEWACMPNEEGIRDDEVLALCAVNSSGKPVAVLFNYACHQTTVNLRAVSGDFAGHAQRVIQKEAAGATALYLQGCEGNVRPRTIEGGEFRGGNWAEVARFGEDLGKAVLDALKEPMLSARVPRISGRIAEVNLPLSSPLKRYAPFRVQRLSLGERVHLFGFEGEAMVEYGLRLKEDGRKRSQTIIPVGIANGLAGDIPTAEIRRQGGLGSSADNFKSWGLPGPFSPESEEIILKTIRDLSLEITEKTE